MAVRDVVQCNRCHGGARCVRAGIGSVLLELGVRHLGSIGEGQAPGAVWVATGPGGVLRVADGGEVLDRVEVTENLPVACMLGGVDRKTLYIPTTINAGPEELARERKSRIETVAVDVPGAGWPA